MDLCIFILFQFLVGYKQQDKIGKLNSWKSQLLHFIMAIYVYSVHCSKLKLWQLSLKPVYYKTHFLKVYTEPPTNRSHMDGPKAPSGHRVFSRHRRIFYIPAAG